MYERRWVIPPQATGGGVAEPRPYKPGSDSHLRQVERLILEEAVGEISPRIAKNTFKTLKDMKTVFVTVGTTKFDQLIENITSPENVQVRKICRKR